MNFTQSVQFHEDAKKYGSILGLDTIRRLMHELNDVHAKLNVVHIAGTNGKGSVSCFLASALKEAGYIVGQFNSPAVFDLREVCQINGAWIGESEYASCMEETALAFLWFFRRKCDIVLLETGMGGSLDATNLMERPLCSVFTSIGMDHTDYLGDSIGAIAREKAGIIKPGCPVVSVRQQPEAERILRQRAEEKKAAYVLAREITESKLSDGRLWFWHPKAGEVTLSMTGSYQTENASLAIETLDVLKKAGYSVSKEQILKGMKEAKWSGRFECLSKKPLFYIDGAHNTEAAQELKTSLFQNFPNMRRIGIMGVMADKPYEEMTGALQSAFDLIYTVTPNHTRALTAQKLADACGRQNIRAVVKESVFEAVKAAYEEAEKGSEPGMVLAFGSLYYLKEVKDALYEITKC